MTKKTNSNMVYDILKNEILKNILVSGDHLTEIGLAKKYSVSRLHIKEALQKLQLEQLVEHIHDRGYFVLGITQECIEEITELRLALTSVIVKNVINIITETDIKNMHRILNRLDVFIENEMFEDCIDELKNFYHYFQNLSSYKRITNILNVYDEYIFSIVRHSVTRLQDHQKGLKWLRNLLKSLEEKDLKKALETVYSQNDFTD